MVLWVNTPGEKRSKQSRETKIGPVGISKTQYSVRLHLDWTCWEKHLAKLSTRLKWKNREKLDQSLIRLL